MIFTDTVIGSDAILSHQLWQPLLSLLLFFCMYYFVSLLPSNSVDFDENCKTLGLVIAKFRAVNCVCFFLDQVVGTNNHNHFTALFPRPPG